MFLCTIVILHSTKEHSLSSRSPGKAPWHLRNFSCHLENTSWHPGNSLWLLETLHSMQEMLSCAKEKLPGTHPLCQPGKIPLDKKNTRWLSEDNLLYLGIALLRLENYTVHIWRVNHNSISVETVDLWMSLWVVIVCLCVCIKKTKQHTKQTHKSQILLNRISHIVMISKIWNYFKMP